MINIVTWDRLGAQGCARSAHIAFGTLAEYGGECGVSMRGRAAQLVQPDMWPTFTAAPRIYLKDVVPPSVVLHERSP